MINNKAFDERMTNIEEQIKQINTKLNMCLEKLESNVEVIYNENLIEEARIMINGM